MPNPLLLAAGGVVGYQLPRAWNTVVARHTDDSAFESEMREKKTELINNALSKRASFLTTTGGVIEKGLKGGAEAVGNVGKSLAMQTRQGAPISERLVRPLALAGVVGAGYIGTKAVIDRSKPYNYSTYERNLVRYGQISPSEMSRSGFNAMVKQSSAMATGMNVLMGGFAVSEGIAAAKKVKTPISGSAIQQSAVYGDSGGSMNNFK